MRGMESHGCREHQRTSENAQDEILHNTQDRSRAPVRCPWWQFVAVVATWHAHRGPNDGMNHRLGIFLAVGCHLVLTWSTHRGVAGGGVR